MTDLSHAQKALAAFKERHELCGPFDDDWVEQCLAAALEAVADEVVPEEIEPANAFAEEGYVPGRLREQRQETRRKLLAIAAELRGDTTNQED